ncbi:formate/nitrite transporter family protein [Streptomyces sp. NPDC051132]|uniref:formate/nitrite transporter family protein n=1 Tax=unclassified Streptomyces TaxID=2593676 RepID=UPI003416883B
MVTTAAPSRTRIASLAVRARNIVDSGLCTQTSAVPDWLVRLDHLEHLAAIPAPTRRALLAGLDDDIVCDLMVLSHLRTGTTYALWTESPGGFAQDVLRGLDAAAAVLVMNLIGGWVFTWLVMRAYPGLHPTAAAAGAHFVDGGYTLGTVCLAVLGGGVITLMTRMHHGTESMTGKIIASIATAFVLAGLGLWHSVLDSLVAFAGLHTGRTPYGYVDWLG